MSTMDDLKKTLGKLEDRLEDRFDTLEDLAEDALERVRDRVKDVVADPRFGGLHGLVDRFRQQGLEQTVASWIGRGANAPISVEQLQLAIGPERIQAFAERLGVAPSAVTEHLTALLPAVVDRLTPEGRLPEPPAGGAPPA